MCCQQTSESAEDSSTPELPPHWTWSSYICGNTHGNLCFISGSAHVALNAVCYCTHGSSLSQSSSSGCSWLHPAMACVEKGRITPPPATHPAWAADSLGKLKARNTKKYFLTKGAQHGRVRPRISSLPGTETRIKVYCTLITEQWNNITVLFSISSNIISRILLTSCFNIGL